jgi:protein-S-isoprenylcysteine O-methyltransferase Ste14
MTSAQLLRLIGYIWAVFGIYWVAAGLKGQAAQTQEAPYYRLTRLGILAFTFALLFSQRTAIGILGHRFVFESRVLSYLAFSLALIGLAVAIWARVHLGQYWSDKVVLKVDHQLIRSGPYAYMRHPIYSGVLLGVAGTALLLGEWRGVLAFAILLCNYVIKARREEAILAARFEGQFQQHIKSTGFLFPRFPMRD